MLSFERQNAPVKWGDKIKPTGPGWFFYWQKLFFNRKIT